jgi:hypothetical protein
MTLLEKHASPVHLAILITLLALHALQLQDLHAQQTLSGMAYNV